MSERTRFERTGTAQSKAQVGASGRASRGGGRRNRCRSGFVALVESSKVAIWKVGVAGAMAPGGSGVKVNVEAVG